jgi:hypothetical protein
LVSLKLAGGIFLPVQASGYQHFQTFHYGQGGFSFSRVSIKIESVVRLAGLFRSSALNSNFAAGVFRLKMKKGKQSSMHCRSLPASIFT